MPSIRSLAKSLSVSTISVQRAYTELQKDGIGEAKITIQTAKQNGVTLSELQELVTVLWNETD